MISGELINDMIPPVKLTDSVEKVLRWMDEFRVHQLPVVDKSKYLGLISETILYDSNEPAALIGAYKPEHADVFVRENQHFYDIIKTANDHGIQVVAVLDDEDEYVGLITIKDTVTALSRTCASHSPGGIVVMSMDFRDYSLAEISRLVESDNAKILSSYIEEDTYDRNKIKLTIKINRSDLTVIIKTLERFSYKIIAKFQETEYSGNEQDRLGLLFKFFDI